MDYMATDYRTGNYEVVIYPKSEKEQDLLEQYILSGKFDRDFRRWQEDEEK